MQLAFERTFDGKSVEILNSLHSGIRAGLHTLQKRRIPSRSNQCVSQIKAGRCTPQRFWAPPSQGMSWPQPRSLLRYMIHATKLAKWNKIITERQITLD
jgi:hypothetical protein